jgi:hypothetical protein
MSRPGPAPTPDGIPPIAARQGGVFTAAQAVQAGWTPRQVKRRRDVGRWIAVTDVALTAAEVPLTPRALAWSARLTWPGAVVSHVTAGILHGFPLAPDGRAHVMAPRHRSARPPLLNHRHPLSRAEVQRLDGLLVTTPRRTALDCLGWLDLAEAIDLWAWLSSRQVIDAAQLADAVRRRTGWRSTPQLLQLSTLVRRGAASRAEWTLHRLLDVAGISGWDAGATLSDEFGIIGVADVVFREQRVVIEVDGWRSHGTRTAFEHDRRRQNQLSAAGYLVLRVTWDQLTRRPDEFLIDLRRVLASRS